jgi:hypothetical protein
MSELTVIVTFTTTNGDVPATGLALGDIDLYLTRQDRVSGALTTIWDGTQNPTAEITNTGQYRRIYSGADENQFHYFAAGLYTGAVAVDAKLSVGANEAPVKFPVGAVEFTYTLTNDVTLAPIEGAEIWFSTDNPTGSPNDVANIVWKGETDVFGVARDAIQRLPVLDVGTYYVWRQLGGFTFANPDIEVVSL